VGDRKNVIWFLVGLSILEALLIIQLLQDGAEMNARQQYLIEQNALLQEARNAERRLYEMRERTFDVCSNMMRTTFNRLGLLRPEGIGVSVLEALSIQTGGS
jgi:triphosphoribosyl-dephospho-CoA synthetase